MKEKIKYLKTSLTFGTSSRQFIKNFSLFIKQCHRFVWSLEKIQKLKIQNL